MAKVIKGTKDNKIAKQKPSTDSRQIRCTNQKCRNLVQQVPDGKGGLIHQCTTCGTKFSFSKM